MTFEAAETSLRRRVAKEGDNNAESEPGAEARGNHVKPSPEK